MRTKRLVRLFNHLGAILIAATISAGCGGGSDEGGGEEPTEYVAETAPVEGGSCQGERTAFCYAIELELCEAAGCEIYEQGDEMFCFGEVPRPCGALEEQDVCEGVDGCTWVNE